MNVILTGVKASGKSTIGPLLAEALRRPFIDIDDVVVRKGREAFGAALSCAEIYRAVGELQYRRLENDAVREIAGVQTCVLATGGSTLLSPTVRQLLFAGGKPVFLNASADYLWRRIAEKTIPSYLEQHPAPKDAFYRRAELIRSTLMPLCNCIVDVESKTPAKITADIQNTLGSTDGLGRVAKGAVAGVPKGANGKSTQPR